MPKSKRKAKAKALAYKIEVPNLQGLHYFVEFLDGVGILSPRAIAAARPGWFNDAGEQIGGVPISDYVTYWEDKVLGKATPLDLDEAEEIRDGIQVEKKKREGIALDKIKKDAKKGKFRPDYPSTAEAPEPEAEEEDAPDDTLNDKDAEADGPPADLDVDAAGSGDDPPEAREEKQPHED